MTCRIDPASHQLGDQIAVNRFVTTRYAAFRLSEHGKVLSLIEHWYYIRDCSSSLAGDFDAIVSLDHVKILSCINMYL